MKSKSYIRLHLFSLSKIVFLFTQFLPDTTETYSLDASHYRVKLGSYTLAHGVGRLGSAKGVTTLGLRLVPELIEANGTAA